MNNREFTTCIAFAILLAGFLAYSNSFYNDFVWDDASSILRHQHVQDPSKFLQLFKEDLHAFGRGQGNFYRPLLAASFMLDYALSRPAPGNDPSPFLFHLSNTLWHIAAALLLLAILRRFEAPRAVCTVVPILYVLHPIHTQAVTYISGRGDPMSATFLFAALWFALWEGSAYRRLIGTSVSLLAFVAGVLSKESATIFPVLLLLLASTAPLKNTSQQQEFWLLRLKKRWIPLILAIALAVAYFALRSTLLRFSDSVGSASVPLVHRLLAAMKALAVYVRLAFVPTGLHMERTLDGVPTWSAALGVLILLLLLAGFFIAAKQRQHRIVAAFGWFLISWFPISGIIPLNAQIAEHWMYVPIAGLLWALAEVVWLALEKRPFWLIQTVTACVLVVALVFLALTARRNLAWRDNETLFRDTLVKNPRSARVHFNLAVTYEDLLKNLPGARRHYEKVLELYEEKKTTGELPKDNFFVEELESHLSLGRIFLQQNEFERAGRHFMTLLRLVPNNENRVYIAEAAVGMGNVYLDMGDNENAQKFFEQAAKMNTATGSPDSPPETNAPRTENTSNNPAGVSP